jgi:hypothetical protein
MRQLLPTGEYVYFDKVDARKVLRYKWYRAKSKSKIYAQARVKIDGYWRTILMHRLILGVTISKVDHEDGDGLNNRRNNLRKATNTQNGCNRKKQLHGSTSKYKGVCWNSKRQKWRGTIKLNGKAKHLGYFHTEILAAQAYDVAAKNLHGAFARTNFE